MTEAGYRSKTISAFFYFKEPEAVGNAVIIHTISFLIRHFNLIIYTNQAEFLRSHLPGVKIISLYDIKSMGKTVFGALSYCRKIAKFLNSDRSDAVFTGHNSAPIALWLNKPCFQYVYQVQEMIGIEKKSGFGRINQAFMEFIILKGIRAGKANFVVSGPIMEYLKSHNCKNLFLAPHCVDLKRFSVPVFREMHREIIRKKRQGYFIVCYTGWVSEVRGLYTMLESTFISLQRDQELLFVIAGSDDSYSGEILNYFKERDLAENVICMGKIGYDLIPGVIALSDVCLSILQDYPAYRMSPPQKVIEYFASGKPVIANRIQTHTMLITEGYNGFLTENDPAEISEKILFLKANPGVCEQMSVNAMKTASKYDTSEVYKEMEEVIDSVLNDITDPGEINMLLS
jgi:glycosyltransferase involved in cell wall biosynthesis